MRAISLWQPWATAMGITMPKTGRRLKRFETRGWEPAADAIGQRLAICAAKTQRDPETREKLSAWWMKNVRGRPEYHEAFAAAGFTDWVDLPFGAVVLHGRLVRVAQTEALLMQGQVDDIENDWGNYGPGRYGWELDDVVILERPVPIVGKQGIFLWDERLSA